VALVGAAAAPAVADAHGLPSPPGVPVPGFVFAWAAAFVLVASFAALAKLWREPRLEGRSRSLWDLPAAARPVVQALSVGLFVFLVAAGISGNQDPDGNILPPLVYAGFWVGLVLVSLLFGDVFSALNPWRAIAEAVERLPRRRAPLAYPARLGRWPAALTVAAFVWLELVYVHKDDPSTLAWIAIGFAAVQIVAYALFGVRAWSENGDGFAVYFNLFGRIALLRRRPLLSGVADLDARPGTIALLCAMVGSTSFDGLTGTTVWHGHGTASGTLGLLGMIAVIAVVYLAGVRGMRLEAPDAEARTLALRFVHSLVPIAAGYVLAHYIGFLVDQVQLLWVLASDPLGHAEHVVHYHSIGKTTIWVLQVGALVAGHIGGLVLAHDRAIVDFADPETAQRSQRWMLTVMVGYTGLGLWLVSSVAR
jgi:hypothetical protein